MIKRVLICLLFLISLSCNEDCKIDKRFKKRFSSAIETIQDSQTCYFCKDFLVQDIQNAVFFLVSINKIEPSDFDIEHGAYYKKDNCRSDIRKWKNWYKNNKCGFTLEMADSMFANSTSY